MRHFIMFLLAVSMSISFLGCGGPPVDIPPKKVVTPPPVKKVEKGLVTSTINETVKLVEKLTVYQQNQKETPVEVVLAAKQSKKVKLAEFYMKGDKKGFKTHLDVDGGDQRTMTIKKGEQDVDVPGLEIALPSIFDGGLMSYEYDIPNKVKDDPNSGYKVTLQSSILNKLQIRDLCASATAYIITKVDHDKKAYHVKVDDGFARGSGTIKWSDDHDGYLVELYVGYAHNDNDFRETFLSCILTPRDAE